MEHASDIRSPVTVLAVVFAVISLPWVLKLVPRNWGYGFRTKKTLSSDEVWYPANRFAGIAGLVTAVVYGVLAFLPDQLLSQWGLVVLFGPGVLWAIVLVLYDVFWL